jgi:hypothetical protein
MVSLDFSEIKFEQGNDGFLRLQYYDDKIYHNITCIRLFPLTNPDKYISVCRVEENEYIELGIILDISLLNSDQQEIVRRHLELRYFIPEIIDIYKITTKNHTEIWDVLTDKGEKQFIVKDKNENVWIFKKKIVINDVNNIKYKISEYQKLPKKARILIEKYLL